MAAPRHRNRALHASAKSLALLAVLLLAPQPVAAHDDGGSSATNAPRAIRPQPRQDVHVGVAAARRAPSGPPIVAILDSGIDLTHPAFAGRIVGAYDYIYGGFYPVDSIGHGTAVAGLIAGAGSPAGVCPDCLIMPLRVTGTVWDYGGGGAVDQADLALAIEDAVQQGARVLYIGAGFPGVQPALAAALASAESAGVAVIAAAGNEGFEVTTFPAASPTVVSVVALDATGGLWRETNTSGRETVAAVGEDVPSTAPGGGYGTFSGSSIAAATAAGVAARAIELDPTLSAAQVRQILRYGTVPLGVARWYETFALGQLDAVAAAARSSAGFADVAVARLTLFPQVPLGGQSNCVRVRIANQGNVPTGAMTLTVMWGDSTRLVAVGSLDIADSSIRDVDVDLWPGVAGDSVPVSASVSVIAGETLTSNNTAALLARYRDDPVHDLALELGALSEPVFEAGSIQFPITVRNRGNQSEPLVTVTVSVDSAVVGSYSLSLPPRGEATIPQAWIISPPEPSGPHTLAVQAWTGYPDADSLNNVWLAEFDVGSRADPGLLQYADRPGHNDIVFDAPWKTTREYVPILVFFPDFEENRSFSDLYLFKRKVERVTVSRYDPATGMTDAVPFLTDERAALDGVPAGTEFIDPDGRVLANGLPVPPAPIHRMWHYILRVPHVELPIADEPPDVHYLRAAVEWKRKFLWLEPRSFTSSRVLRVLFDPLNAQPFPRFDPADRYYDAHVHTVAEQTRSTLKLAPYKNFGGPIAMLLEASFCMGLVDVQLNNANWAAFKNKLVVTDHNVFYTNDASYDSAPSAPAYGPTGAAGPAGEGKWYRDNFGRLAGEEVALKSNNQLAPDLGHHFLAYDAPHVDGPWHGGVLTVDKVDDNTANPNTMLKVLKDMKDAQNANSKGFGYAAHPYNYAQRWGAEQFGPAIGNAPNNLTGGSHVDKDGRGFIFKGSQVWNGKTDLIMTQKLPNYWNSFKGLDAAVEFAQLNPFAETLRPLQRFKANPGWDTELKASMDTFFVQIRRGMDYSFKEKPDEVFIRKLYMSAGTDAHGDFNYDDDITATLQYPMSGSMDNNAYARVRTYTLVHDDLPSENDADIKSQNAYRHGNTVLTDGPICKMSIDPGGRHNPVLGVLRWHDAVAAFEDAVGRIGGEGVFDALRTVLIPANMLCCPGNNPVMIRTQWKKSFTPDARVIQDYDLIVVGKDEAQPDTSTLLAGPADEDVDHLYPGQILDTKAIVLQTRDRQTDERCITNPIWAVPVGIYIDAPATCPYPPGTLHISFHFPISMRDTATSVVLQALDGSGNSTSPEFALTPDPGWAMEDSVANGVYAVTNAAPIPCPTGDWDADAHQPLAGAKSFVVTMLAPLDIHLNRLNEIAATFRVGDLPTPVLVARFEAEPSAEAVELSWSAPVGGVRIRVKLYRGEGETGEEELLATVETGYDGGRYRDERVRPGATYSYRLGLVDGASEIRGPSILVTVPAVKLELIGVTPNPSRGASLVRFSLPRASRVRLGLYAVSGRREAVLADRRFEAGVQSLEWNGLSDAGRRLPAGVYFLKLEVGGEHRIRRVVIVR